MGGDGASPSSRAFLRGQWGELVGTWARSRPYQERVTPAAVTVAALWVVGGAVATVAVFLAGIHGSRPTWALVSTVVAMLIGILLFEIWRLTGDDFPWLLVHLSMVAAGAGIFAAADAVNPGTVAVAVLALAPVLAVLAGALTHRPWALFTMLALSLGINVILVRRQLQPDEVGTLLCVLTVAGGFTAGTVGSRLRHHALTDPLTGLPNRGSLELLAALQIAAAMRNGKPLALVLIDLDDFKAVNGARGRGEGDRVLGEVGSAWSRSVRASDVLCRYIGDQFVLLLPDCGPDGVTGVVQRMLESTAQRGSCGATGFVEGDSLATMLGRAERSMREAKGIGRGEIVMRSEVGVVQSTFAEVTGDD